MIQSNLSLLISWCCKSPFHNFWIENVALTDSGGIRIKIGISFGNSVVRSYTVLLPDSHGEFDPNGVDFAVGKAIKAYKERTGEMVF